MALTLTDVLRAIYECEDNCSLSSDWDGVACDHRGFSAPRF